jgi:hypothetical protein
MSLWPAELTAPAIMIMPEQKLKKIYIKKQDHEEYTKSR